MNADPQQFKKQTSNAPFLEGWQQHARQYEGSTLVYPVLSRRSRGISLGINLSPGKLCNFNCQYCQVERDGPGVVSWVDLKVLRRELEKFSGLIAHGDLYTDPQFSATPAELQRFNDIAFSGDGEPTASPYFPAACQVAVEVKERFNLTGVKLVVITNSTLLHLPQVAEALELISHHEGEIWAKLDAGTEPYYHKINGGYVPYSWILDNILTTARRWPVVIQSLFFRLDGAGPDEGEIDAYVGRLNGMAQIGAQIKAVHLLTVARDPHNSRVAPLANDELDRIADLVARETALPVERFYGLQA